MAKIAEDTPQALEYRGGKGPLTKADLIPAKLRPHRCLNCGHEQLLTTNHKTGCLAYCKECSWKPSFGMDVAVPMFGHPAYRRFVFIEEVPNE